MLHSELVLEKEEINIEVLNHIDKIIKNPSFNKIPKQLQEEILNLRDVIERY